MRLPIPLFLIVTTVSGLMGWDGIHGQSTIEQDRIHLSVDSLVITRGPVGRSVCVKGRMRLLLDTNSPQARMAVVFFRSAPDWDRGRGVEFAIDRSQTIIQTVDYDTGSKEVVERAPYGFRLREWVPFVVTFARTGDRDVCRVRLFIHNTRVTLKHTMEADTPITAFGFLALRCEIEVMDVETETE